MTKKELIKKIENYKLKYIYQRYNGEIRKFEVVNDNFLVETKTGLSIDFKSHLMLGKLSENTIDLIEVGDYVNGKKIDAILDGGFKSEGVAERILCFETDFPIENRLRAYHDYDIKTILTKEKFKANEYIVKE